MSHGIFLNWPTDLHFFWPLKYCDIEWNPFECKDLQKDQMFYAEIIWMFNFHICGASIEASGLIWPGVMIVTRQHKRWFSSMNSCGRDWAVYLWMEKVVTKANIRLQAVKNFWYFYSNDVFSFKSSTALKGSAGRWSLSVSTTMKGQHSIEGQCDHIHYYIYIYIY